MASIGEISNAKEIVDNALKLNPRNLLLNQYNEASPINVGTGEDVTIKELAETVGSVVGNKEIEWDTSKPNGTPRKVLDVSKIKSMGWKPTISLRDGIESTYQDYIK